MPPIEGCRVCRRLQFFTFSLGVEIPTPEFWFGEFVDFCWNDENTGEHHCETGVVVGVAWNQVGQEWQYIITWLSSTVDFESNYPIFDMNFVAEEVLCRP